jgi:Putative zinc-finger
VIDDDDALDGLLAPLAGAGPKPDPAEHPSDDTLSSHAEGKLAEAQELEVQEHLAVCGRCRDLLLEFASFVEVPLAEQVDGVADLEAAKVWRALQIALSEQDKRTGSAENDDRLMRSLRTFKTLAAVLGAMTVGLIAYAISIHPQKEVLPLQAEVLPLQEPVPFATNRSGHVPEKEIQIHLPYGLSYFTPPDFSRYRVEVVSAAGSPLVTVDTWLHEGVLVLRPGMLSPGGYRVQLSGLDQKGKASQIGHPRKLVVLP